MNRFHEAATKGKEKIKAEDFKNALEVPQAVKTVEKKLKITVYLDKESEKLYHKYCNLNMANENVPDKSGFVCKAIHAYDREMNRLLKTRMTDGQNEY